jgi:hypothetical protein
MVTIRVGNDTRPLEESDPNWLTQAIQGRRNNGLAVCVVVTINEPGISVVLQTTDCQSSVGGGRTPRDRERQILSLWEKLHLHEPEFAPGNLVAFVKQLPQLL